MGLTSIDAAGWSGQYASPPAAFTPDTAPEYVLVTRKGYDATATLQTNITDALVIGRRVRNVFPNQATDTANTVAFSSYIYSTDSVAGVTNNNTTIGSPVPIAAFIAPDGQLVGNTIGGTGCPVEIIGYHRNGRSGRWVATVAFTISDGTNAIVVKVAVTQISTAGFDAVGNAVEVFALPATDITSLNPGTIKIDAKLYPWIGDASSVLDSASNTTPREFSTRYYLKNVAKAATPPLAYVNSSTGSDTSHAGWSTNKATALAAPYATVQGAINDIAVNAGVTGGVVDACRIRIMTGTASIGASALSTRTQNLAGLVIESDPDAASAMACIVTIGTLGWRPRLGGALASGVTEGLIEFRNLKVQRIGAQGFIGEAAAPLRVRFINATFDNGASNYGSLVSNANLGWFGTTIVNFGTGGLLALVGTQRIIRGVVADLATTGMEHWVTLGCTLTRPNVAAYLDPTKGAISYCNTIINPSSTTAFEGLAAINAGDTITGAVYLQNVIEVTHTTTSTPGLRLSSDTPAHGNTRHCIIGFNTVTGYAGAGRENIFYDNSAGTTSFELRNHDLNLMIGESAGQINIKGDVFSGTQGYVNAAAHIGNFAIVHGVDCRGNYTQYATSSGTAFSEYQTYGGLGSKINITDPNNPQAAPSAIWTDYRGTTGTGGTAVQGVGGGAGGGTYTLVSGAPLAGLVTNSPLSFDKAGKPRSITTAAGPYEAPGAINGISNLQLNNVTGTAGGALLTHGASAGVLTITGSATGALVAKGSAQAVLAGVFGPSSGSVGGPVDTGQSALVLASVAGAATGVASVNAAAGAAIRDVCGSASGALGLVAGSVATLDDVFGGGIGTVFKTRFRPSASRLRRAGGGGLLTLIAYPVGAQLDYPITHAIDDDDTIVSSDWDVTPVEAGGLDVVYESSQITDATTACLFAGGVLGRVYEARNTVMTNAGRCFVETLTFRICEDFAS